MPTNLKNKGTNMKLKLALLLAVAAFSLSAQTVVSLPTLTVSAEATAALNTVLTNTFAGSTVTLTAPVGISDTTLNVVSTVGISGVSALNIEGEAIRITARTANTYTVTRGYYGTTPAAHPQSAVCIELLFPTFNKAFMQAILNYVGTAMDQAGSGTIATQNAVITSAQAAKLAAKTAAVQ